jgi:hypothetical protein
MEIASDDTNIMKSSDRHIIGIKPRIVSSRSNFHTTFCFLKSLGIDIALLAFLHYKDDIRIFGNAVFILGEEGGERGKG